MRKHIRVISTENLLDVIRRSEGEPLFGAAIIERAEWSYVLCRSAAAKIKIGGARLKAIVDRLRDDTGREPGIET